MQIKEKKNSALIQFENDADVDVAYKCMNNGQIDGMKILLEIYKLSDMEVDKYKSTNKLEILKDIVKEKGKEISNSNERSSNFRSVNFHHNANKRRYNQDYNKKHRSRSRSRSRSKSRSRSFKRNYSKKKYSYSSSESSSSVMSS
jgi:hypothetical protein